MTKKDRINFINKFLFNKRFFELINCVLFSDKCCDNPYCKMNTKNNIDKYTTTTTDVSTMDQTDYKLKEILDMNIKEIEYSNSPIKNQTFQNYKNSSRFSSGLK